MASVIAAIFMSLWASKRKCQKLHLSFVRSGSIALKLRNSTRLSGLRWLCLSIASISAPATAELLP